MDYKKSKAPVNTVTRNIMDLCEETGNIYESVAIIAKRANQISVEIKQDLNLRRFLRIVSRLRSHATMRSFRSRRCLPLRSSLREMCIIATPLRTMPPFRSRLNVWRIYY